MYVYSMCTLQLLIEEEERESLNKGKKIEERKGFKQLLEGRIAGTTLMIT